MRGGENVAEAMTDPLAVTVLELPARWGAVPTQLGLVEALLERAPPGALTLLGEASLTGYLSPSLRCDPTPFAEPLDGPTARHLADLAKRHHTHLFGPLIERSGERCFNTMIGFSPDGTPCLHYRKRHPWDPETWATPGDLPYPLLQLGRWTLTLAICFDVHFLGEDAVHQLALADVLLFPSAWVEETDSRAGLLADLARRFGLEIVNANWAEGDVTVPGQGRSMVVGRDGQVRAQLAPGAGRLDVALPARARP